MKPRFGDPEDLAHHRDWEPGPLRRDDPVGAHRVSVSAAKRTAARLRMSRSCSTRLTRLRSSRSSSRSALVNPSWRSRLLELVPLDPVMQRLLAASQRSRQRLSRSCRQHQLHGFAAKLRRIRRSRSWHDRHPFASQPLKPSRGRQTGATPVGEIERVRALSCAPVVITPQECRGGARRRSPGTRTAARRARPQASCPRARAEQLSDR